MAIYIDKDKADSIWDSVSIKSIYEYYKSHQSSNGELVFGNIILVSADHRNFDELNSAISSVHGRDKTPICVVSYHDSPLQNIYSLENICPTASSVNSVLYTYLAGECDVNQIIEDYGEYLIHLKVSVKDYNNCVVEVERLVLLPRDLEKFLEMGIEEFIKTDMYSETFRDFIVDMAKYQYRAGIITTLNKNSAINLSSLLNKYTVKGYGNKFRRKYPHNKYWWDFYLDNALVSPSKEYLRSIADNASFANPEIIQITSDLIWVQLKNNKYLK